MNLNNLELVHIYIYFALSDFYNIQHPTIAYLVVLVYFLQLCRDVN